MHKQAIAVKSLIKQGNRRMQLQHMQRQSICGWDFRFHAPEDFNQQPTEISDQRLANGLAAGALLLTGVFALVAVAGAIAQVPV